MVAENNRNVFSQSSGGQKSEIKVLEGFVPSGGFDGEFLVSSLLQVFVPWFPEA